MGLSILPPDINESAIKYTGKDRAIRIGLMQLKEISQEAKEAIVHEREKNGPFSGIDNFLIRTGHSVHLQDARVLVKAGCFDPIARGTNRPGLMWQALKYFSRDAQDKAPGLFEWARGNKPVRGMTNTPHNPAPYSKSRMLKHEVETLGFLL